MNKIRECYLCGATSDLTRDHLPPVGFFPKPRPSNLITVPCCKICNNSFSKDDEYFRVVASSLINSNPIGQSIWKERVVKSTLASKRIASMIDELRRTIKPAMLKTPFGTLAASEIPFDAAPIERFLIRLTKGLLSVVHPEVNRNDLSFAITQIDQFKLHSIVASGVARRFRHFSRGRGVYRHWRAFSNEDAHLGGWVHMFYDSSTWLVDHSRKS